MTKEQIDIYKYCEKFINELEKYTDNLAFKSQKFGCGSNSPRIEHTLEKIHNKMYSGVFQSIQDAKQEVNKIIEEL